jgi:hypothetical protein
MSLTEPDKLAADVCYRCDYDLRGVGDEQPCPECGLLASRSRRPTDELHHTRPGWLRRLSLGVILILLAMFLSIAAPIISALILESYFGRYYFLPRVPPNRMLIVHGSWLLADLAALTLLVGVVLLTTPEGHPPADRRDAWRRRLLRILALAPLVATAVQHVTAELNARNTFSRDPYLGSIRTMLALAVAMSLLVLLLYFQLRSLAKRARSAHLAEHCVIVGIGNAATLLYIPLFVILMQYGKDGRFGSHWMERSSISTGLILTLAVASLLFAIWNLYLLVRFAIAFGRASRQLRRQWTQSDRALAT